jgi:hypothetical protein
MKLQRNLHNKNFKVMCSCTLKRVAHKASDHHLPNKYM